MTDIKDFLKKMQQAAHEIKVKVEDGGKMPSKAHASDAGWDLYATSDITLFPGEVLKHPLNIRLQLPVGTWAEITTKSGLGSKGQLVYAGVIDEAYRGIPHVVMTNVKHVLGYSEEFNSLIVNTEPIIIKKGEKIAQLIMNPYLSAYYMVQVDTIDISSDRGEGGFGSSGV